MADRDLHTGITWRPYYILDEQGKPKHVTDVMEWAKWMEENYGTRKHVLHCTIVPTYRFNKGDNIRVSTCFLGIDHNLMPTMDGEEHGVPLLFETMVFGGAMDMAQQRCSTPEDAALIHEQVTQDVLLKEKVASLKAAANFWLVVLIVIAILQTVFNFNGPWPAQVLAVLAWGVVAWAVYRHIRDYYADRHNES